MARPIADAYAEKKKEFSASEISAVNVAKREYQKEYMEYCTNQPFPIAYLRDTEC